MRSQFKSTTSTLRSVADDGAFDLHEAGHQLLYSREQARRLLGNISVSTLRRMERNRLLRPIRPTGARGGRVFYSAGNVISVARGRGAALEKLPECYSSQENDDGRKD